MFLLAQHAGEATRVVQNSLPGVSANSEDRRHGLPTSGKRPSEGLGSFGLRSVELSANRPATLGGSSLGSISQGVHSQAELARSSTPPRKIELISQSR